MALALTFLIGTIVAVTLARSSRDEERPKFNSNEKSIEIVANLNRDVNPCEDFYEYACGNFAQQHPRGEEHIRNYFTIQGDRIEEDILKLLRADVPITNESAPEAYTRELYKKCVDDVTVEFDEFHKLRDKINSIFNDTSTSLISRMATVSRMGLSTLVSMTVIANPFDTSKQALAIDRPALPNSILDRIFNAISDKSISSDGPIIDLISKSLKLLANITDDKKDDDFVNTVYVIRNFTRQLAAMRSRKIPANLPDRFHPLTLAELDATGFDWSQYIQLTLDRTVDANEKIIVGDIEYVKKVASIVKNNASSIEPFLQWSIIQTHGIFTGRKFRDIFSEFMSQVSDTFNRQKFIDETCRELLEPEIVGRMYVKKFITEEDKKNGKELIDKLTKSFRELIDQKEWMDKKTKEKALLKLDRIICNVGYPEWLLNDTALEEEFAFMSKGNISFTTGAYELASAMTDSLNVRKLNTVGKSVNLEHEWPMSPVTMNAAYASLQNTITIPASILRGFFFSKDYPDYVNYGQVGSIIGHELTHAFDVSGSQFDETGSIRNWWSNETRTQFNERAKCMIDQYSQFSVSLGSLGKMTLNGNLTIGENIADNGGIRQAFRAWSEHHRNETESPLDGLEKLSPQKLFFIAYANNWCGDFSFDYLYGQLLMDPHPPAKYRVNVPLSNYPEFADAFKCPLGSKMNPEKKCQVW